MKSNALAEQIQIYDHIFTVETSQKARYLSDHVIIATGGKSYPKTGSDGIGYKLAEDLGHAIIPAKPALTDIRIKEKKFLALAGLSFDDVEITIWHDHKKIAAYVEDLLFTHKGLSGPAILNASRWMNEGDTVTVNFLYPKTYEEIKGYFTKTLSSYGKEELITFLKRLKLPKSFCSALCEDVEIDEHMPCAKLSRNQREALVKDLTRHSFTIEALGGFHLAMATAGGISLKEINPTTMESRKEKGLFFAGEVMDIDGNTGGYNIQAAFSTAYLCAEAILKTNKK